MPRVIVAIAEEENVVEVGRGLLDVTNQRRARRPLTFEPSQLVVDGMDLLEHLRRSPAELVRTPFVRDREPPDLNAVDLFHAGGRSFLPRDVVAGARCHDLDGGVPREPLCDVTSMQFRAAVDVGAVALNDDGQLHDSDECPSPPSSCGSALAGRLVSGSRESSNDRARLRARAIVARCRRTRHSCQSLCPRDRTAGAGGRGVSGDAADAFAVVVEARFRQLPEAAVAAPCPAGTGRPLRAHVRAARRSPAGWPSIRGASSGFALRSSVLVSLDDEVVNQLEVTISLLGASVSRD